MWWKGVDERMSSEQVQQRVKAIRKIRNGVVIETANEKERKALYKSKRYESVGLTIQLPRKIGPKVSV